MFNVIVPLSDTAYESETGRLFVNDDNVDEFKLVSEEDANKVFGEQINIFDYVPTFFRFSVDRENPLKYYKTQEERINKHLYIKYHLSVKTMTFKLAFKIEVPHEIDVPPRDRGQCLIPISPEQFQAKYGYAMHVTSGECSIVPASTLYGLMYGAPDLSRYTTEENVELLKQYPIDIIHIYKPIIRGNRVIERFLLTTAVKRIIIGGYREHEKN